MTPRELLAQGLLLADRVQGEQRTPVDAAYVAIVAAGLLAKRAGCDADRAVDSLRAAMDLREEGAANG